MDPTQAQAQAQHMILALMPVFFLVGLVFIAIIIVPIWRILTRMGLGGPLALLIVIPWLGPIILLYIVAFSRWNLDATLALPTGWQGYPPPSYPPPPADIPPAV